MSDNKIKLKSVDELLEMKFFIPSYQRGYRWTEQQVKDLLNDINEFASKKKNEYEFYCLQPLVVKEMDEADKESNGLNVSDSWYEVIDGQQRLTTIYLIIASLKKKIKLYQLMYQRKTVIPTTASIDTSNIDSFYMSQALTTIKEWLDRNDIKQFCDALLSYKPDNKGKDMANNVRFIWYETDETNPIRVFTRLNIGKISLTNAELIKALFLNRSNFGNEDDYLRLRQQEIASEWDNIEYTLQNDEFWLFLHKNGYDRPTRIDFIFDLIYEQNAMQLPEKHLKSVGTDEYKTFRYFYEYFKQGGIDKSKVEACWAEVKKYFQIFQEWFNDLELYHYIGYLIEQEEEKNKKNNDKKIELLKTLLADWYSCKTKDEFIFALKDKIKDVINSCKDLNKLYEISGSPKTQCRPLLLLYNIQTIINQNKDFSNKEEYELPVFYKFPFHLFKKENWDVEHIDSNTTNGLEKENDQKEWLKYALFDEDLDEKTRQKIKIFLSDAEAKPSFDDLANEVENESSKSDGWKNAEQDKNKIWNFVLLDAGTNRGYGNAIFPAKRRCIIGKDQGVKYEINENFEVTKKSGAIAFIPPVTRNVFLKYYNTSNVNFKVWNREDAEAYKKNILETLKEFCVTDSSDNQ